MPDSSAELGAHAVVHDSLSTKKSLTLKSTLSCRVMDGGSGASASPPKEKPVVQNMRRIAILVMCLAPGTLFAQAQPQVVDTKHVASLDAEREKRALESLLKIVEKMVVS